MPQLWEQHVRWNANATPTRRHGPLSQHTSPASLPPKKPGVLEALLGLLRLPDPFAWCLGRSIEEEEPTMPRGILKVPTVTFKVAGASDTEMERGRKLNMKRVTFDDALEVSDSGPLAVGVLFSYS